MLFSNGSTRYVGMRLTRSLCGVGVLASAIIFLRLRPARRIFGWLSKRLRLALHSPDPLSFLIVAPDVFERSATASTGGSWRHFAHHDDWIRFLNDVAFQDTVPAGKQ